MAKTRSEADGGSHMAADEEIDFLSQHAGVVSAVMRGPTELIGSLRDWRFLRAASRHFSFVANDPSSPLNQSVAKFHASLRHSGCRCVAIAVE